MSKKQQQPEEEPKKRKPRKQNPVLVACRARLYNEIVTAFKDGSYKDKYWHVEDLAAMMHENNVVNPKRKSQTYTAISQLRPIFLEEFDIEFYSIVGKGYCILHKKEDYIRVAQARLSVASSSMKALTHIAKNGKITDILLSMVKPRQLEDAKKILSLM